MNRRRDMQRAEKGSAAHLVLIALLASIILGLSSCGGEKESVPGTQPSAPQQQVVKPTIAATKLEPKAVTASKSAPGSEPKRVIDGDVATGWIAGDTAPQWIQLDFGQTTTISAVLLNIDQSPDGPTTHQVYGGQSPDNLKLLRTLDGDTKGSQWLDLKVAASDIRYVKVVTIKSPSWVAWHEIEVYK